MLWPCTLTPAAKLNQNDALPLLSTLYPFDFLNSDVKASYAHDITKDIAERFQLSVNLFTQSTNWANDADGFRVPTGDVNGRLGLLPMCYGSVPTGKTESTILTNIAGTAFTFVTANFNATEYSDPAQYFGFFSVASQYRKMGTRFQVSGRIFENVVITLNAGACDMRQSSTGIIDERLLANVVTMGGSTAVQTEFSADTVTLYNVLTRQWKDVMHDIGVNYSDWHALGIEDMSLQFTYRKNIPVQQEADDRKWTKFVFIPHLTVIATGAFGEKKNPDILLSLPFGNNGHHSLSLMAGLALAFNETIEVFAEGGITEYASQNQDLRVPTSIYQSGLYPYKTRVKVTPSNTYQGTFGLNAHYFIDKLSTFVQVNYAAHEHDSFELLQYDPAYILSRLETDTEWKYGVVNVGLNYDLSPSISLGAAAQLPMGNRASYLSNTFMIGMTGTF